MSIYMPGPNDPALATPLEVDILDILCTTCRKMFEVSDVPVVSFKQWLKDGRPADIVPISQITQKNSTRQSQHTRVLIVLTN